MSKWIKIGEKIVVIAGNDKGKTGAVVSRKGDRVVLRAALIPVMMTTDPVAAKTDCLCYFVQP